MGGEMSDKPKLTVGQKLWWVGRHRERSYEVTVVTVGRKWATIDTGRPNYRIDLETLIADGGKYSSPGMCYLSKKHWEVEFRQRNAWYAFSRRVAGSRADYFTLAQIEKAAEVLGFNLVAKAEDSQ
jgi:hypothetical protein